MTFIFQDMTKANKKRRNLKAVFGGANRGERLSDPEYLAMIAPPPLDSETEKTIGSHQNEG